MTSKEKRRNLYWMIAQGWRTLPNPYIYQINVLSEVSILVPLCRPSSDRLQVINIRHFVFVKLKSSNQLKGPSLANPCTDSSHSRHDHCRMFPLLCCRVPKLWLKAFRRPFSESGVAAHIISSPDLEKWAFLFQSALGHVFDFCSTLGFFFFRFVLPTAYI